MSLLDKLVRIAVSIIIIDLQYTRLTALEHSLAGWVMNTSHKTVVGQLQGKKASVRLMKKWLKETGSPKSRIDRCKFSNEKTISSLEFSTFTIRK
ncbi:Acylphosphatase-2 [Acropora cervicornis]|uniref:acylphosphatase n=1 Tax=Acropora cervicornis TaxID=6130 RepID=A0AAD9PYU1_ACRCE|nr:Acylphosphatase-2 [Acropora cervicornis]